MDPETVDGTPPAPCSRVWPGRVHLGLRRAHVGSRSLDKTSFPPLSFPPPPRPPALGVFPCRSVDLSGGGDRPELDGVSWILGEPSPRLELRTDRYLPAWASREGLPRLAGRLHLLHVPVPSLRSRSPGRPDGSESAGSGDSRAGLGDKCPDGGSGDTPTSCGWAPLLGMDIFRGRNRPFLSPGRC